MVQFYDNCIYLLYECDTVYDEYCFIKINCNILLNQQIQPMFLF